MPGSRARQSAGRRCWLAFPRPAGQRQVAAVYRALAVESHLARVDLTGWAPGDPVSPEIIYAFDYRARMLNGSCLLAPGVMLIADALAGLIDLATRCQNAVRPPSTIKVVPVM
jgi:hypothetical protein